MCDGEPASHPPAHSSALGRPVAVAALLALKARALDRDESGLTAVGAALPLDKHFLRKGGKQHGFKQQITDTATLRVIVTRENFRKCVQILGDEASEEE